MPDHFLFGNTLLIWSIVKRRVFQQYVLLKNAISDVNPKIEYEVVIILRNI